MNMAPYKLPNGCVLEAGGRIRVPWELVLKISSEDIDEYNIDIEHGDSSPASDVLCRPLDRKTSL